MKYELSALTACRSTRQYTLRHQQEANIRETGHSLAPCRIAGAAWAPPKAEENLRLCSTESRNGPVFHTPITKLLLGILT